MAIFSIFHLYTLTDMYINTSWVKQETGTKDLDHLLDDRDELINLCLSVPSIPQPVELA